MSNPRIPDDFYPGLSIHRNLRQSPEAIVNRYASLLKRKGFEHSSSNVNLMLRASRELFQFVTENARDEIRDYHDSTYQAPPVRGTVIIEFDLVYRILSLILDYFQHHPKETLESAAAIVVIEQFLEEKLGNVGTRIWRKILSHKSSSSLKQELGRLSKAKLAHPPKTAKKQTKARYPTRKK